MDSFDRGRKKVLLVLGALLLALPTTAAIAAEEGSSAVQAWRRARELMAAGEAERAREIYDRLLDVRPGHNAFLLGRARAALAVGRADEAAADYAVLLGRFPDEPELRREAAEAERRIGRHRQAALLDEPPPPVDIRAARLATILPPRAARPHTPRPSPRLAYLSGAVRTGVMYDSNANQGPSSELFSFGDLEIELPGTRRKKSMAAYFGANLDFLRRLGEESPWAFVADARLYVRANANRDLAEFKTREWQWGRLAAGFRYQRDRNFFEFRFKGETFDYQFFDNVSAVGPEFTYARALTGRLHLITQLSGDVRVFKRASYRNGFYAQAGQYARVFFRDGGLSLLFGGKLIGNYAREKRPSYHGYELSARLTATVAERLQLSPHVSFTREQYRKPGSVLENGRRRDNQFRAGLDASYRVNERLSLEAGCQYVRNNSRSDLYSYRQLTVSGGVAWGF